MPFQSSIPFDPVILDEVIDVFGAFSKPTQFFLFPPIFRISEIMHNLFPTLCSPDCYCNSDANLNAENVMGGPTKFRIFPDISMQINMVDSREVTEEVSPHPIESHLI